MKARNMVVFLDDDADDIDIFTAVFSSIENAPHIKTFRNTREVIDFLKSDKTAHQICLLLLDVNMPVISGGEFAEIIKKDSELSHLEIAFISTSESPKDMRFAESIEAEYYIKPDTIEGIRNLAKKIIEHCNRKLAN